MNRGYTLIELSVVLGIISVIIGSAAIYGIKKTEAVQVELTAARMNRVADEIGRYLFENGGLPCPADPDQAPTSNTFGTSSCPDSVISGCGSNCSANLRSGAVPFITLGIPDEYMVDAWGRKISYVVDYRFTTTGAAFNSAASGDIYVYGVPSTHFPGTSSIRTTTGVMVLLSYGADGHGAWPKGGGASRVDAGVSATALQAENADTPSGGNNYNRIFRQVSRQSDFDDILMYYDKNALKKLGRGVIDTVLCTKVANTLLSVNYSVAPKRGGTGCAIDNNAGYYDAACLVRQKQLAGAVKCYQ